MNDYDRVRRKYPDMTHPSIMAMTELLAGIKCVPTQEVVDELGHIGLAYCPDRRRRSRRIVLTVLGSKLLP